MANAVVDVTDLSGIRGKNAVLLFWAPWQESSAPGGLMHQVLGALATSCSSESIVFGRVQAEEATSVAEEFKITVVPTFLLLNAAGTVANRVEGVEDVAELTRIVQAFAATSSAGMGSSTESNIPSVVKSEESLSGKLNRLINSSQVMLFMKGTPTAPRCGFSRQAVELLEEEKIPFGSFDILQDEIVRQGLKTHSNWPTYPQIYVKGELVGGLDILKEMKEDGESLKSQLNLDDMTGVTTPKPLTLNDRLDRLINKAPVMLFMKGLPSVPRCGFSRQIVELLDEESIPYDSFDILQDEEVRQGLKAFSNWPTYPQLYVKGELVGGLDIVQEMKEDSSLKEALGL